MKIKLFASLLALGLLAGCSSKTEVEPQANNTVDTQMQEIKDVDTSADNMSMEPMTIEETADSYINEVVSTINGKAYTLKSIHFDFDNYTMNSKMQDIKNDNVIIIKELANSTDGLKIRLEGNSDEWGADEYNFALGLKRTKTVKSALVKSGISASDIVVVSYGESNPLCNEKTAKCWKQNRRVDHLLLP